MEVQRVNQMMENSARDEADLEIKIEKKRQELERNRKRLRSLSNVRLVSSAIQMLAHLKEIFALDQHSWMSMKSYKLSYRSNMR